MCLDVLRLGFATARSGEKRWRTTAVQNAGALADDSRNARMVLEMRQPSGALDAARGRRETVEKVEHGLRELLAGRKRLQLVLRTQPRSVTGTKRVSPMHSLRQYASAA